MTALAVLEIDTRRPASGARVSRVAAADEPALAAPPRARAAVVW